LLLLLLHLKTLCIKSFMIYRCWPAPLILP
jgi:hypothetical protein